MPILLDGTNGITTPTVTYEGNVVISGTGRRIIGDFSNATATNRVSFQTSTTNGASTIAVLPNGTATTSAFVAFNNQDPANANPMQIRALATEAGFFLGANGTASAIPMTFWNGGSERLRIETNGNLSIGNTAGASNTLRYFDIYNTDSGANAGTIIRLITNNIANNAATTVDMVKYRAGGFLINNNDTGAANYSSFNVGASERMRITSGGRVGIGTTSIDGRLHVRDDSSVTGKMIMQTTDQKLVFKTYWQAGVGQNASIQSTNNAEVGGYDLLLNPGGGNLLLGASSNPNNDRFLLNQPTVNTWSRRTNCNNYGDVIIMSAASGIAHYFVTSNGTYAGDISCSGSTTNYASGSDYRLKENIAPMTGALDIVQALKPVTYNWKSDGSAGQGFIAHELQSVVPDCVTGEKDAVDADGNPKYQGVDTSFLVATLTAAIQEQQAIIETLKSRLDAAGL
jgi:hypothetical protein